MMRIYLSHILSTVLFLVSASGAGVDSHAGTAKGAGKPCPIDGTWMLVCGELGGKLIITLPHPKLPGLGTGNTAVGAYLWKIADGKIEAGPDNELFPLDHYTYELNPGGKQGTIDLVYRGRAGDKLEIKSQGIYWVKDGWLFLCDCTDGRPERFTISGKDPSTIKTDVFRRVVSK